MPLLADYAITPDVFDISSYPTAGECEARIETIREAMLTEGLVRDLRDGEWGTLFGTDSRPWHPRGTKLIKELATQGRLVRHEPELPCSARSRPVLVRRGACYPQDTTVHRRCHRDKGGQERVPQGADRSTDRPARRCAVVEITKSVREAHAHARRLPDATRHRAPLFELAHLYRSAPGSSETEISQLRSASHPRKTASTAPEGRNPPCLLRGIETRTPISHGRRPYVLRAPVRETRRAVSERRPPRGSLHLGRLPRSVPDQRPDRSPFEQRI